MSEIIIWLNKYADISAISETFSRRLRLGRLTLNDKQIYVKEIGKTKVFTTTLSTVKISQGCEVVYEFEIWIIFHHKGVDHIIGTIFIIPARFRLDLLNATAKLPYKIAIPLLRSAREVEDTKYGYEIVGGPSSSLYVETRLCGEFQLRRK